MTDSRFRVAGALVAASLVLVTAAGILDHGFLNYDDPQMIAENPRLADPSFADVITAFTEVREFAWLPIATIASMPDAAFFGGSPRGFHAGSLLWHAICAALVLVFTHALLRSRTVALLAACIFAVHPIAAESVAWASGRKDQVSFALLILALAAALGHLRHGGAMRIVLSAGCAALAVLAKGSAVVYPLLATLVWLLVRADGTLSERARPRLLLATTFLLGAAGAAVHMLIARAQGTTAPGFVPAWDRLLVFCDAVSGYVRHLVVPVGLSIHYDVRPGRTGAEIAGVLVIALGVVSAFALARRPREPKRSLALCAAWFLAALLPFNGVFPQTSVAMADRYAFIALPAFAIAAAILIAQLSPRARVIVAVLVIGALLVAGRARYAEFRDGETVFRAALRVDDADSLAALKLGEALRRKPPLAKNRAEAVRLFQSAVATAADPVREARARLLLADTLLEESRFSDALLESDRLLAIEREHGDALRTLGWDPAGVRFNRAAALLGAGRRSDAITALDEIIATGPDHTYARLLRAGLDAQEALTALPATTDPVTRDRLRERVNGSIAVYESVIADLTDRSRRTQAVDQEIQATSDLSRLLQRADWRPDRLNAALMRAEALIRRHPDRAEGYVVRAQLMGDVDRASAAADLRAAAGLDPASTVLLRAIANGFLVLGKNREAINVLESARARDPSDPAPAADLRAIYIAAGRNHLEGQGGPDLEKARQALRLAKELGAEDPDVLTFEAESLDLAERPEEAIPVWERVLRNDAGNAKARLALARGHQRIGLGILANMRALTESNPAERRVSRRDELIARVSAEFGAAVALAPDADEISLARGWLRQEKRRASIDPLLARARAAAAEGRIDDAMRAVDEAAALDPTYVDAAELSGHLAMQKRDLDRAFVAFERTLALDPDHLAANDALARIHHVRGERDRALERARRFLALAARMRDETPTLREEIDAIQKLVLDLEGATAESRR